MEVSNMLSSKKLQAFVELTRPYNATSVIFIFLIGVYFQYPTTHWIQIVAGVLLLVFLHSAATVQNDLEDEKIDLVNNLKRPLGSILSRAEVKNFLYCLFGAAIFISLLNNALNRIFVPLFIGLILLYNTKPFFLSRRPIASVITLVLCSSFAPLVYGFMVGNHMFTSLGIVWFVAWLFIRSSITLLKDYKDEKGDKQFNKRTFLLAFGKPTTAWTSIILSSIGYISLFILALFMGNNITFLVIPFIFAAISFIPRFSLLKIKDNAKANNIFHEILVKENRFELVYLLWIIFSQ